MSVKIQPAIKSTCRQLSNSWQTLGIELFNLFFPVVILCSCTNKIIPGEKHVYNDSIHQQFWSADWSPDDKFIAVAGVDSIVRIYHANNLTLYKSVFIPSWIHAVKWNHDCKTLAIATSTEYVQLLDIRSGKLTKLDNKTGPSHEGNGSRAMDWNYSNDMLAVGGMDGVIKIWDKNGNLLSYDDKYPPATDFTAYLALDWHPYRNILVAGNFEIQVYDSTCRELNVMQHANKEAIMLCAAWHPSQSVIRFAGSSIPPAARGIR